MPLTLIPRRWPCAFFLSDSEGMLDVKDTVLGRELASIALATRKTKNFFRGMLSAFRAGERHRFASLTRFNRTGDEENEELFSWNAVSV